MKKWIIIIIAAFLATLGVFINLSSVIETDSLVANSILYIVLFGAFLLLIKRAVLVNDKRVMLFSFLPAIIIAGIEIVGRSLEKYNSLLLLYISPEQILLNILEFIGLIIMFYSSLVLLFSFLEKRCFKENDLTPKPASLSITKKALIIWLVIFLAWLPYFLTYFPGIITVDSFRQLEQALGVSPWTNYHPVFHTFIIQICMQVGSLFGSNMAGVAVYSIMQMIVMSGIFAFTVFYMEKRNVHRYLRRASIIFYAAFPIHAMYSITMWKDIFFAGMMLLFVICLVEIVTNPDRFLTSRKYIIFFVVITILIILLRNNGLYIILISFPFIILAIKEHRKKLILIFGLVIIVFAIYTGPLFSALDIAKGNPRKSLSVPLQQMARVAAFRGDMLNDAEIKVMDGVFSSADIAKYYNPRLADPVKNHFDPEYYEENKMLFYSTWIKMFFRFPKVFIESYLANSFGYWYPETVYATVSLGIKSNDFGIIRQSLLPDKVREVIEYSSIQNKRDLPVISMIYSIGFNTLVVLSLICLICIKKQRRYLLVFVPIVILLLTVAASPINTEFRYVYSVFTCLPILLAFALCAPSKPIENSMCPSVAD